MISDYFRAPDDAAAVRIASENGPPLGNDAGVEAKGIDPEVALGQLIAIVRKKRFKAGMCDSELVWSEGAGADTDEGAVFIVRLPDVVRDDLASVDPLHTSAFAAKWVKIEELEGWTAEDMEPTVAGLCRLARQARANGEHLYNFAAV